MTPVDGKSNSALFFEMCDKMGDVVSKIYDAVRTSAIRKIFQNCVFIPAFIKEAADGARAIRVVVILSKAYDQGTLAAKLISGKSKEAWVDAGNLVAYAGEGVEVVSSLVGGIAKMAQLSAKVSIVASYVGFAGAVVQVVSIGVDIYKIVQIKSHLSGLKKAKKAQNLQGFADHFHRFKDVYNVSKKRFKSIMDNSTTVGKLKELYKHFKLRAQIRMGERCFNIMMAVIGIAAVAMITFAPTPVAPIGFGLAAGAALASLIFYLIMLKVNDDMDARLGVIAA